MGSERLGPSSWTRQTIVSPNFQDFQPTALTGGNNPRFIIEAYFLSFFNGIPVQSPLERFFDCVQWYKCISSSSEINVYRI